jgi:TPR repeat protein
VPINDFAIANEELANEVMDKYYSCCGKEICRGCVHSFCKSGNTRKCPFCNADQSNKIRDEQVEDNMKRVEANDAVSICVLADSYYKGLNGVQQDRTRAMELYARSAELGFNKAHYHLGMLYHEGGDLKKAKFHFEAAAKAGHEVARFNIGMMEANSGNVERAVKNWKIAASAGEHCAMNYLRLFFDQGHVSRESINTALASYNKSCAEVRSEARDAYIRAIAETI